MVLLPKQLSLRYYIVEICEIIFSFIMFKFHEVTFYRYNIALIMVNLEFWTSLVDFCTVMHGA